MAPYVTRREALGGAAAALVLASCGGGDPPPATGPRPGSGVALLGSLLALERASFAAYGACLEVLTGDARARCTRSGRRSTRTSRGSSGRSRTWAASRRPAATARSTTAPSPPCAAAEDALRFAEDLEERQVRAYLEALTEFPALELRLTAAGICSDEANHLGTVRVLQGLPAAQGPFVTGAL